MAQCEEHENKEIEVWLELWTDIISLFRISRYRHQQQLKKKQFRQKKAKKLTDPEVQANHGVCSEIVTIKLPECSHELKH